MSKSLYAGFHSQFDKLSRNPCHNTFLGYLSESLSSLSCSGATPLYRNCTGDPSKPQQPSQNRTDITLALSGFLYHLIMLDVPCLPSIHTDRVLLLPLIRLAQSLRSGYAVLSLYKFLQSCVYLVWLSQNYGF